ncbi:MAG: molecular chaperone DnaK, partial [Candidatus Peregrinibacteria bacterium Greene0416_62]
TAGIISAKGRQVGVTNGGYEDFLQTDAAVNPGNSGGPLVNIDGQVIGINTAIASRSGGSSGIGFAIPANMARNTLEQILKTGKVVRGRIGAAVQAGILGGDIDKDIVLVDVTPLSMGLETLGGVATKVIERNTKIPTKKSQVFSTAADNQSSVEIHVVQGEREMAADNKSLGRFILDGIPSSPRGMPQIEVSFDIDANGILHVTAKDLGTGKTQHITIQGSTGLSKEEIERMKKDAEVHAEDDKKKKEGIDARNAADALVFNLEKQVREYDAKIPDTLKKTINTKIGDLKDLLKKEDASTEDIKKATEALSTEAQAIGKIIYAEAQKKESASSKEGKGDVVEGEVVEDDAKK